MKGKNSIPSMVARDRELYVHGLGLVVVMISIAVQSSLPSSGEKQQASRGGTVLVAGLG